MNHHTQQLVGPVTYAQSSRIVRGPKPGDNVNVPTRKRVRDWHRESAAKALQSGRAELVIGRDGTVMVRELRTRRPLRVTPAVLELCCEMQS